MWEEFKAFLSRGNMVDMAVGFVLGAGFSTVLKSLVSNIIMPPVGMIMGNSDFSQLFIALDGKAYESLDALERTGVPAIKYGLFINDIVTFVLLGVVMFFFVRSYNRLKQPIQTTPTTRPCPTCAMDIPLHGHKCPYCAETQLNSSQKEDRDLPP